MSPADIKKIEAGVFAGGKDRQVSAGELRALGLNIGSNIPDCAWVPAYSISFRYGDITADIAARSMSIAVTVEINEPFRWVEATVVAKQVVE